MNSSSSSPAPKLLFGSDLPDLLKHEMLPDLLEATALRVPDKIALISENQSITYDALNRKADLVAHHLILQGVQAGDKVGLWMPRGIDLLVAMAGITKAGAAWLPMDADIPVERVLVCMDDANAAGLVTTFDAPDGARAWSFDLLTQPITGDLKRREGLLPSHPAYVIYTSGSTGKPKGIQINHGSICHFLRSENHILGVREDDLVYQGFSVAFDMSFEEIWISYLVGASLWLAPKALVSDPQRLPIVLREQKITVLHAVPTLLALFAEDVPNLRIINLGGEMCPDSLVEKWATPSRQMFNTYGPTEATVSASLAQLKRGEAVTIGTPLPNYGLLVLDEKGQALLAGQTGELCIFGPGVADGYLGRPDLTAEKFIQNPYATREQDARLYRTGDLACINEDGRVQCLGRADDQIKIRGFRVELGEIEAVLCEQVNIGTAAVILKPVNGIDQLVAYLVADDDSARPSVSVLRQALRTRLPAYMIPACFEFNSEMPRLTSGKIDRKALKALPVNFSVSSDEPEDEPQNDAERQLFVILRRMFPGQPLRLNADFFDDLGGHSLLAAQLVSELRQIEAFGSITVQDIYGARCLGVIANRLLVLHKPKVVVQAEPSANNSNFRRLRCGAFQVLSYPFLIALRMLHWMAPFFTYHMLTGDENDNIGFAFAASIGVFLLSIVVSFIIPVVLVRLLQLPLTIGKHPLWGWRYFLWWFSNRAIETVPVHLISGSSLYPIYWRALGAKVGKDVVIGSATIRVPKFVSVASGVSIGSSVNFENAHISRGELVIGKIDLANEAYVGSYSVLAVDTQIGDYGHLDGLSALSEGTLMPANERWHGSPGRFKEMVDIAALPKRQPITILHQAAEYIFYVLGALLISVLFFVPIFPVFVLVDWLDVRLFDISETNSSKSLLGISYFILAIPACAVMVVLTALLSAAIRWTFLPRLSPGSWTVHSLVYYRKWFTNQIQESSLSVLHGVYATLFAPSWYRLLGANIGKGAEISTAMGVVPDMLTLGDDTFIADAVMLGDDEVDAGWMTLRKTIVHHRSFVGNGAYVPDGTEIPSDVLIGVQSAVPENHVMKQGETWAGTPAMRLPARESFSGFAEHLTFRPNIFRRIARGLIEAARIVLPQALTVGAGYLIIFDVLPAVEAENWSKVLWRLIVDGLYYGLGCFGFVILLKWLLVGRYKPTAAPMWTLFVWLSEAVTNLYEAIAVPNCVNFLRGTPMLPAMLRLLGAKIGKQVYLDTTDITEFDCAYIGDHVEMNALTGPQTHLFEDRIMKIGEVKIHEGVTVHPRGTILYSAIVEPYAQLGPLSLVMKGEQIPAQTKWIGSPTQPWQEK